MLAMEIGNDGSQSNHTQNQWLHTTLSELEKSTKAMQRLMEEEEEEEEEGGGSGTFEKRAELYYQKRPELAGKVEEFRRFYHLLAEQCNHLTLQQQSLVTTPTTSSPEITSLSDNPNHESTTTNTMATDIVDDEEYRDGSPMSASVKTKMTSCSVELARDIEHTICELVRRNEEKREAKKELGLKIKRLAEENHGLRDRLRETMFENVELHSKINSPSSSSTAVDQKRIKNNTSYFLPPPPPPQRSVVKISTNKSNFSKLRTLFFGRCLAQNRLVLEY